MIDMNMLIFSLTCTLLRLATTHRQTVVNDHLHSLNHVVTYVQFMERSDRFRSTRTSHFWIVLEWIRICVRLIGLSLTVLPDGLRCIGSDVQSEALRLRIHHLKKNVLYWRCFGSRLSLCHPNLVMEIRISLRHWKASLFQRIAWSAFVLWHSWILRAAEMFDVECNEPLIWSVNRQQKTKLKTGADWKFAGWIGLVRDAQMNRVGSSWIDISLRNPISRSTGWTALQRVQVVSVIQLRLFDALAPAYQSQRPLLRFCCDESLENAKQNVIPS
jgi:hypothetical protein